MKNSLLLILLAFVLIEQGCKNMTRNYGSDSAVILYDLTDSFPDIALIRSGTILPALRINRDSLYGAEVTFSPITNIRYNQSLTVRIPSDNLLDMNEFTRRKMLHAFKENLDSCCIEMQKKKQGTDGSCIFFAIANALNDLGARKGCDGKVLIVYSDLRENTPSFSTYAKSNMRTIKDSPHEVRSYMDNNYPILNPLKGVKIYFQHQPITPEDDEMFFIMSHFLQTYYRHKGAEVFINGLPTY